jgi:hypothetical protein
MPVSDLRERLQRESERVTLAAGAADRMFERGRRRERTRRTAALVVGVALLVLVIVVVRAGLPGGDRKPEPATPAPTSPADVAGSFSARLPIGDVDIERLGINGWYSLVLRTDGTMDLTGPRRSDLPGAAITFDVERGRLTTDAFVGATDGPWLSYSGALSEGCDTPGVYGVTLDEGSLTLEPIDDRCEVRSLILATRSWTSTEIAITTDRLQGDWTSTFTCEQMVLAVDRAPVPPAAQDFWDQGVGAEIGSDDPSDPCSGVSGRLSQTFRFDDGRLLIFDAQLREGFDGAYELRGNTLTIRDATGDNIDGRYRARLHIEDDEMRMDLIGQAGRDPFFVGTWESAPFIRDSG